MRARVIYHSLTESHTPGLIWVLAKCCCYCNYMLFQADYFSNIIYSKIPIIRPPLRLSKSGLKDHFWTVPKVVPNQMHTGCKK